MDEQGAGKPRKLRWLRVVISACVLIAFAAGSAGAIFVLRRAPELTADAIGRALGRKVQMGQIEVRLGLRFSVEVRDLRIYPGQADSDEPLLEAPVARGYQAWPRILLGQLVPQSWELESPIARVAVDPSSESGGVPNFPLQSLEATDAILYLDAGTRGQFKLDQLSFELGRPPLLGALIPGIRGSFAGRVSDAKHVLGRAELEFLLAGDEYELSGRLDAVDLARVAPHAGIREQFPRLRGTAGGEIRFEQSGDDLRLRLDVAIRKLRARIVGIEPPLLADEVQLAGTIERTRGDWSIRTDPLRISDFAMRGNIEIDAREQGRVRADLQVDDFVMRPPGEKRINLISLLGLRLKTWRSLDERLLAGQFSEVGLRLDLPKRDFWSYFGFPRPLGEDEFRFAARVRDGMLLVDTDRDPAQAMQLGEAALKDITLREMAGSFELAGDAFRVRDLVVKRGAQRFPRLDLAIVGFSTYVKLPPEERAIPAGPGVAVPGLQASLSALSVERAPEEADEAADRQAEAPRPLELEFSDFWVGYPGLLFQIRNANGRMRFLESGPKIQRARAVVAGGWADLDIDWQRTSGRIDARIEYTGEPAPPSRVAAGDWMAGRLRFPNLELGPWKLTDLTTRVRARAGTVDFADLQATMGGGVLQGGGDLDLTRPERGPVRFQLSLKDADASRATAFMQREKATITGVANADMRLDGALDASVEFMDKAKLDVDFYFTDGTLVDLPIALQIARLPSLEGVRGLFGQALPYKTMSGRALLREGKLRIEDFSVTGPQLRALAAGRIDLSSEDLDSDLVVVLLFLQTLDRVLGQVPILGQMLLGSDGSLVSLGFRVRGAFANPTVTPATPATLRNAADWTGGWLRRVGELIPGLRSEEGTEETAPEPEIRRLPPLDRSPRDAEPPGRPE